MTKKPTIRDVAALAGVSPSTVSRVVTGQADVYMKPTTRSRVLQAIEELNYTPTRSAQRMRRKRCGIIGVLVPDISNPYFSLLARGVESIAFEKDYSTLICDSNHSEHRESRYLDLLVGEQVDGVVFVPVGVPDWPRINRMLDQGTRVVVADRCVEGLLGVEAANWQGSYSLTQHVLAQGHHRIAYIAGPPAVRTTQERVRGFEDAMAAVSCEPVAIRYGEYTFDSGHQLAMDIIKRDSVDALMAGDDLVALGAIRAAQANALHVPDDLSVTGFDAVPLLSIIHPELTSVRIPVFEIGQESMSMLARHIGAPELKEDRRILEVQLIPGASCRARLRNQENHCSPLLEDSQQGGDRRAQTSGGTK